MGDFKPVQCVKERKIEREVVDHEDFASFNNFIDDNMSVDFPLVGRSYAWYRGGGR